MDTLTTKDRLALVTVWVKGEPWVIVDIRMRMLFPRELYRGQGFPETYIIDRGLDNKPLSKKTKCICVVIVFHLCLWLQLLAQMIPSLIALQRWREQHE